MKRIYRHWAKWGFAWWMAEIIICELSLLQAGFAHRSMWPSIAGFIWAWLMLAAWLHTWGKSSS